MPISAKPYRHKTFVTVKDRRMAYIEANTGNAIVFQHGNPTSSYLWRNIMPYCEGLGRLIACDLIGMGDSDKLENSGADRYTYAEHCEYLFVLWDQIGLGNKVIMVLHDWGSALGFEWAMRNRDRMQGIVYMEAIVTPLTWADWPENARRAFQGFRSESGERMILEQNMFVERVLLRGVWAGAGDVCMGAGVVWLGAGRPAAPERWPTLGCSFSRREHRHGHRSHRRRRAARLC